MTFMLTYLILRESVKEYVTLGYFSTTTFTDSSWQNHPLPDHHTWKRVDRAK